MLGKQLKNGSASRPSERAPPDLNLGDSNPLLQSTAHYILFRDCSALRKGMAVKTTLMLWLCQQSDRALRTLDFKEKETSQEMIFH